MAEIKFGKFGECVEVYVDQTPNRRADVVLGIHNLQLSCRLAGLRMHISADVARAVAAELLKAADELEKEE